MWQHRKTVISFKGEARKKFSGFAPQKQTERGDERVKPADSPKLNLLSLQVHVGKQKQGKETIVKGGKTFAGEEPAEKERGQ